MSLCCIYGVRVRLASQLPLLEAPPWRRGEPGYLGSLTAVSDITAGMHPCIFRPPRTGGDRTLWHAPVYLAPRLAPRIFLQYWRHPGTMEGRLERVHPQEQEDALCQVRWEHPVSLRIHTDHDMLRFLRARDFDVGEASAMYERYLRVYLPHYQVSPKPLVRPVVGHSEAFLSRMPERCDETSTPLCRVLELAAHVRSVP